MTSSNGKTTNFIFIQMKNKAEKINSEFLIFRTEDEKISVDVRLEGETVWLTIEAMAKLFEKSRSTINEHILNIYAEGELQKNASVRKIGNSDFSTKPTNYYNLDVIISVGYRVKSLRGTQFRQWATKRLNEYIRKGFTMDDERLKNLGGGGYWQELLQRIHSITTYRVRGTRTNQRLVLVFICFAQPLSPSPPVSPPTRPRNAFSVPQCVPGSVCHL